MKVITLLLAVILLSFTSFKADKKGKVSICHVTGTKIPMSTVQQIVNDNCVITYADANGNSMEVTAFTFAIAPGNGNAYFEKVSGNLLTPEINKRLSQAKPKAIISVSDVSVMMPNGKKLLVKETAFHQVIP